MDRLLPLSFFRSFLSLGHFFRSFQKDMNSCQHGTERRMLCPLPILISALPQDILMNASTSGKNNVITDTHDT